jgi:hypothetical protein
MEITLTVVVKSWITLSQHRKLMNQDTFINYLDEFEQEQSETYLPELCSEEQFFTNLSLWRKLEKIIRKKDAQIMKRAQLCFTDLDTINLDYSNPLNVFTYFKTILQREFEKEDRFQIMETIS